MRVAGLVGRARRRRARATVADPAHLPAPNLVARDFAAPAPDRLWIGDIMCVPTWEGWLYLAVLLDAHLRRVIGWAMADHLRVDLALDALGMALAARRPAPGLVHHTDRGCQYTAAAYAASLVAHGLVISMSRAGICYDNAMAESFFATLKAELIDTRPWPTRRTAQQAIFEWIAVFYNRQRSHSALGYRSPTDFENTSRSDDGATLAASPLASHSPIIKEKAASTSPTYPPKRVKSTPCRPDARLWPAPRTSWVRRPANYVG
jgi:transposase InsO family protein